MFIWLVVRDVDFAMVGRTIADANWVLLVGLSVPSYLAIVFLRALRWRHLTDPIQPMQTSPLFRAVAVGFMANNIFPLRMGEVVRSLYLSREVGAPPAAVFGTVVLERVIDTVMVIGLAAFVLSFHRGSDDAFLAYGAIVLIPIALAPLVGLVCLRLAPDRFIAVVAWLLRPAPTRLADYLTGALGRFAEGLGALRGGVHLFWIAFHSLVVWLIFSTIPILAGFWAVGIDLGTPFETLVAAWITLAAVGMAVAIPSAPGFFGTYHAACKLALEPFGVAPETAVALGTLLHAMFWVTLTALGLAVLRSGSTSLGEIEPAALSPKSPRTGPNAQ